MDSLINAIIQSNASRVSDYLHEHGLPSFNPAKELLLDYAQKYSTVEIVNLILAEDDIGILRYHLKLPLIKILLEKHTDINEIEQLLVYLLRFLYPGIQDIISYLIATYEVNSGNILIPLVLDLTDRDQLTGVKFLLDNLNVDSDYLVDAETDEEYPLLDSVLYELIFNSNAENNAVNMFNLLLTKRLSQATRDRVYQFIIDCIISNKPSTSARLPMLSRMLKEPLTDKYRLFEPIAKQIPLVNLSSDIFQELVFRIYDPYYPNKSNLLQHHKFGDRYPMMNIDQLFNGIEVTNVEEAIEFLEDQVSNEFAPNSEEARKVIDRLTFENGQIDRECHNTSYNVLLGRIRELIGRASGSKICQCINILSDKLGYRCNGEDNLASVLLGFLDNLYKKDLCLIIKILEN